MNTTTQTKWTPEQIEYLQEWAEFLPVEQIAKKIGKSIKQIRDKATKLDLSVKPKYDNLSSRELAKLLGISDSAIVYWIQQKELKAKKSKKLRNATWRITQKDFREFYYKFSARKTSFKKFNQENLQWILEG